MPTDPLTKAVHLAQSDVPRPLSHFGRDTMQIDTHPMEKFTSAGSMLNLQPSTYLRSWEWCEDKVNLIGATQSIMVRIRYEKVLPLVTLGTDPVQIAARRILWPSPPWR